jgi:ribonuclease I
MTRRAEWYQFQLLVREEAAKELYDLCGGASLIQFEKMRNVDCVKKLARKKFSAARILADRVMNPEITE